MSQSQSDSGFLGGIMAFGLLVLLGGGFFLYQRYQTSQVALLAAKREAALAQDVAMQKSEAAAMLERMRIMEFETNAALQGDVVAAESAIREKLKVQQTDWNNGDIDAFMKVYWKSDKLTFSSGGKVTRSWQATLDRYKTRYATAEQRGQLTFDSLEFQPLGNSAMLVLGTWHLERGQDSVGGNFSLVWQKIGEDWLIVHDHTSALLPEVKETTAAN